MENYSETYLGALCQEYESCTDESKKKLLEVNILNEGEKVLALMDFPKGKGKTITFGRHKGMNNDK